MKTKDEILREKFKGSLPSEFDGQLWDDRLFEAMDEYAKGVAIAFSEWCDDSLYLHTGKGMWVHTGQEGDHKTTSELYDIFNEQNKDK